MMAPMEELLKYHIRDTERRFDEQARLQREGHERIHADMQELKEAMQEMREFKVQIRTEAKWVSLVVSGIAGLLTLAGHALVGYLSK